MPKLGKEEEKREKEKNRFEQKSIKLYKFNEIGYISLLLFCKFFEKRAEN